MYKIVSGRNIEDLERNVILLLRQGWKLQGAAVIRPPGYFQAMYKEPTND